MDGVIISPVEVFFQVKFLSQVMYTKLVFDSSDELRSPKEDLLRGSLSCVVIPSTRSIVFICHQPKPQKVRIGPGNNHLHIIRTTVFLSSDRHEEQLLLYVSIYISK